MRLMAKPLPEGGWKCLAQGCRVEAMEGRKDIETHCEREHGAECYMDSNLDLWDIRESKVELFRGIGAI